MGEHTRNTSPMRVSPRCGAETRAGTPCQAPAAKGKQRSRMHGGATGSGAPKGNQNALKHRLSTRESTEQTRAVNTLLRRSRRLLEEVK
jgi:glucans biosynthesis protein